MVCRHKQLLKLGVQCVNKGCGTLPWLIYEYGETVERY
jgi:hypothetical protein